MFKPKYTITPKINLSLTEIERVRGFLDAVKIKESWFHKLQKEALLEESHYSTHIEGTNITLNQARKIFAGKKVYGVSIDVQKELKNYRSAMNFVSKYLGKEDPITEGLIREMHKILVKDVRGNKADPGSYRKIQNYIVNSVTREVIYTPPSAADVPIMMRELVEWLNNISKDTSPVIVSGVTQFQFEHIHPFLDGNGRTGRLLSTLILYKTGYDFKRLFKLSEFYDKDHTFYYQALQSVRKNSMDMTAWLDYFTYGLKTQMIEVKKKGEKIIKRESILENIDKSKFNERQIKALEYMVKNERINVNEYQKITNCIRRTAQRDLVDLVNKNILKEVSKSPTDPTKYYEF